MPPSRTIGAKKAAAMDISAACAGFMYGMITAKQFIDNGAYKNVLVVGVEKLSKITDWDDRNTAVLFGDAAGAAVIGPVPDGKGILALSWVLMDPEQSISIRMSILIMNGREVFKFAVRQMGESSINVIKKPGLRKRMLTS